MKVLAMAHASTYDEHRDCLRFRPVIVACHILISLVSFPAKQLNFLSISLHQLPTQETFPFFIEFNAQTDDLTLVGLERLQVLAVEDLL